MLDLGTYPALSFSACSSSEDHVLLAVQQTVGLSDVVNMP